jgi:hypothetical protein
MVWCVCVMMVMVMCRQWCSVRDGDQTTTNTGSSCGCGEGEEGSESVGELYLRPVSSGSHATTTSWEGATGPM